MPLSSKTWRQLLERDPGLLCAYCAVPLALPWGQTSSGHLEWEATGWELFLLPTGEPLWEPKDGGRVAHRDHVQAGSQGGSDGVDNLVLSCDDCNLAKKADPLLLFFAKRAGVPRFQSVGGDHRAAFAAAWAAG